MGLCRTMEGWEDAGSLLVQASGDTPATGRRVGDGSARAALSLQVSAGGGPPLAPASVVGRLQKYFTSSAAGTLEEPPGHGNCRRRPQNRPSSRHGGSSPGNWAVAAGAVPLPRPPRPLSSPPPGPPPRLPPHHR